jgi:hypothetical protein
MLENRSAIVAQASRQRSAVTNNRRMFVEGDGNSAWSRRFRDLVAGHVSDLGGKDMLSETQLSLVRRASAIECELEQMEGKLSKGEQVDLDLFTRTRRVFEVLGIERKPRPVEIEEFVRFELLGPLDFWVPSRPAMSHDWRARKAERQPPPGGHQRNCLSR